MAKLQVTTKKLVSVNMHYPVHARCQRPEASKRIIVIVQKSQRETANIEGAGTNKCQLLSYGIHYGGWPMKNSSFTEAISHMCSHCAGRKTKKDLLQPSNTSKYSSSTRFLQYLWHGTYFNNAKGRQKGQKQNPGQFHHYFECLTNSKLYLLSRIFLLTIE